MYGCLPNGTLPMAQVRKSKNNRRGKLKIRYKVIKSNGDGEKTKPNIIVKCLMEHNNII